MRIALLSASGTAVPPPKGGSIELIVGLLADELARRGHDVTVFAPGDSTVGARLMSRLPTGYRHDATIWDWQLAEFMQLGLAYEQASQFDVMSSHVYCYALPFTRLVGTPTVHTFHICPTPDYVRFCGMYPEANYVLVSEYQREFFDGVPVTAVVPNGIDTSSFGYQARAGNYLAYLGSFQPGKGPLEAIRCARAAGVPIRLAGPDSEYFHEVVAREVDGRDVEYVGMVNHDEKVELLAGALALVFPVQGPEAFGLVTLESMACGTPVLATRRGPIPEIVEDGVTGICVEEVDQLSEQIGRVAGLDRAVVRRTVVERFDVSRMVDAYLRIFSTLL